MKAEEVLPFELIQEIQKYVSGENIYIPVTGKRMEWGKKSGYREELAQRDNEIRNCFRQGMDVVEIAKRYFLSEKSIYRIVSKKESK